MMIMMMMAKIKIYFDVDFHPSFKEGLHYTLLDSNGKVITRLCKDELEQRIDRESLIRRWKEKLCENRCSKNGKCQNGSCKCDVGK